MLFLDGTNTQYWMSYDYYGNVVCFTEFSEEDIRLYELFGESWIGFLTAVKR